MRREFQLPAEDVRFLDSLGLPWEAILQGSERWVLIHEHPLPDGYSHKMVTVAVLISGGYPEAPLDMFYLLPRRQRTDGVAIPATRGQQALDGQDLPALVASPPGRTAVASRRRQPRNALDPDSRCVRREFVEEATPMTVTLTMTAAQRKQLHRICSPATAAKPSPSCSVLGAPASA